jgi:hypothetical protein
MKVLSRLQKLERKMGGNTKLWAVFTIRYYENPQARRRREECLLNTHLGQGNPFPNYCLFINELPYPSLLPYEEKFLHSFRP